MPRSTARSPPPNVRPWRTPSHLTGPSRGPHETEGTPISALDSPNLHDDEVAVIRQTWVASGRPEIGVVDERQLVVGERQDGLDGLVRELERVAEAEVARADRVLGDAVLVVDAQEVGDLALLQVRLVVGHVDDE